MVEDKRIEGHIIDISFKEELHKKQEEAVKILIKHNIGIMQAATGFGKTVMAINIIALKKVSTLIIVEKMDLMNQWKKQLEQFLQIPEIDGKKNSYIGLLKSQKNTLQGNLDIVSVKSLVNLDNLSVVLDNYGLVIIDECHHAATNTFIKVLRNIKSKYIYSFSATPKREDGLDKLIYKYCGDVYYSTPMKMILNTHEFKKILIPRYLKTSIVDVEKNYVELVNELIFIQSRNYLIIKDILHELENSRKIIVLTERVEHGKELYRLLQYASPNIFIKYGNMKTRDKSIVDEKISELVYLNKGFILLATSTLLGEGFDLPVLDTLFLVMPIRAEARVTQYIGRLHRNHENKTIVKVYDYVDVNIPFFKNSFQSRLKIYYANGYQISENDKIVSLRDVVFDENNYEDALLNDLNASKKEVLICNDTLNITSIKKSFDNLHNITCKGVRLYIVSNGKQENIENFMKYVNGIGCDFIHSEKKHHYIIIDNFIIWTCNFDYLGKKNKSMEAIRLENSLLAEEIKSKL